MVRSQDSLIIIKSGSDGGILTLTVFIGHHADQACTELWYRPEIPGSAVLSTANP
jgi:hypothetical protein